MVEVWAGVSVDLFWSVRVGVGFAGVPFEGGGTCRGLVEWRKMRDRKLDDYSLGGRKKREGKLTEDLLAIKFVVGDFRVVALVVKVFVKLGPVAFEDLDSSGPDGKRVAYIFVNVYGPQVEIGVSVPNRFSALLRSSTCT